MHGNAWHSECSDCNEMNLLDDVFELVKKYPSDADLGKMVRELYNNIKN